MPIAAFDHISVIWDGTWNQQRVMLTSVWRVEAIALPANDVPGLQDIALELDGTGVSSIPNDWRACLPTEFTPSNVRVQKIDPIRTVFVSRNLTLGAPLGRPANNGFSAAPVLFRTNESGRDQVSVKHIGPVPEVGQTAGAPTGAYQTLLQNFANSFLAGFTTPAFGIQCAPRIWHKVTGTSTALTSAEVPNRLGTVRRRILRLGE